MALSGVCPGPILPVGTRLLYHDWILLQSLAFTTARRRLLYISDELILGICNWYWACRPVTDTPWRWLNWTLPGSWSCFSTVRPTVCPSLAYIAVSRCLHLLILPFEGLSWARFSFADSEDGAQLRRFGNVNSQSSLFSLRINNWRSGPWWQISGSKLKTTAVKCNPSCRVSPFDGNAVTNRAWSSHLTPAADHLI